MLKPSIHGASAFQTSSSRAPPSRTQPSRTHASAVNSSRNSRGPTTASYVQGSDSTTEQWEAYANGGVVMDDARAMALRLEEDAKYTQALRTSTPVHNTVCPTGQPAPSVNRLVDISPEKKVTSKNTDLLVDLDLDTEPLPGRQRYADTLPIRSSGHGASGSVNFNLLD
ncbi:hypothetical protein IAQ61_006750 [Plenodomus lingam]|uniref:uncharacterized protein n=1 Tax=Leptosphaeria maculans TaxID=5022 RepID=UPI00332BF057|nr:hypothetical protein IAQ61_006750 [Plenodomus lingam]